MDNGGQKKLYANLPALTYLLSALVDAKLLIDDHELVRRELRRRGDWHYGFDFNLRTTDPEEGLGDIPRGEDRKILNAASATGARLKKALAYI